MPQSQTQNSIENAVAAQSKKNTAGQHHGGLFLPDWVVLNFPTCFIFIFESGVKQAILPKNRAYFDKY